ncbi:hypothetical protein, partial [Methanospirillum hungatei]|uniref:hypothetical protein n=1 Tax=Methanospirillum hungatei TaxID=2203 RepID=UPI0026EDA597
FASIVVSAPSLASPLLVSGVENPLPIFIPELLTAPAPSWVTEGVRFSYNTMVTYGSEEVNQYGFAISSDNAGTGAGITQLTVVGISGNSIAVTTDSYAPKPPYDTMHLVYSHGSVYPAGCGPFWVNPDVIAKVADKSTQTVVVTHLPYSTGGTAYEAIKFDFSSDGAGGILTIIYDLKTGMLLYHKLDIKNNALFQDGGEQYLRQSGSYSIFALRNIRTVQVPWMGGKMPTWVTDGLHLSYSGAKVFSVDGQIGPPAQYPRSSTYVFGSVTNRFVPLVVSTVSQDIITSQSSTPAVSGMAHIGGIFIPPEAMNLGTGTFDQDPDTGIISSITKNDYEGIVVTKTNGYDYTTEFWYNSFGKLIQMIITTMTTTNSGFGSLEQTTMKLL